MEIFREMISFFLILIIFLVLPVAMMCFEFAPRNGRDNKKDLKSERRGKNGKS